jgi:hypothetical protein
VAGDTALATCRAIKSVTTRPEGARAAVGVDPGAAPPESCR